MKSNLYDPLSGKKSIGLRFRFHVRTIAQKSLYLPCEMKALPHIRQLLQGVSPLVVFGCDDINFARTRFYELRKKYDFPYWAALHYQIKDKDYPYDKVPLVLNRYQYYLADKFIRTTNADLPGKYFVTKSVPQCGLTTCVQAYILWLHLYRELKHSLTFTPYDDLARPLKYRLADQLNGKSDDSGVPVKAGSDAFILPIHRDPRLDSGVFSCFHFVDMLKWNDINWNIFRRIFSTALSAWKKLPSSIFVVEGDTPSYPGFDPGSYRNYPASTESYRLTLLSCNFKNPYFVYFYILLTDPRMSSDYTYIDLDQAM